MNIPKNVVDFLSECDAYGLKVMVADGKISFKMEDDIKSPTKDKDAPKKEKGCCSSKAEKKEEGLYTMAPIGLRMSVIQNCGTCNHCDVIDPTDPVAFCTKYFFPVIEDYVCAAYHHSNEA